MHGGMITYTGSPAAARNYVEADRSRADDYYLAEGTGVAERCVASPEAGVRRMSPLTGDAYEAWVAGVDPDTGVPKGRLRHDERAVRFVEVMVNGPKSWSLAAELHPDISAAYDGAQDQAATEIIGWLAQHATTRVGPRGGQVQVPVEALEAVTVRHYTSRAGDPHRHLHLQINARVFAAGQWRGLHTVGVRDCLGAISGIGHAAVATDPAFRAALAAHGFSLDAGGEIVQLAPYVGAFSRRAAQIGRNIDRYEADWRAAHPGQEPGPGLSRAWDARAWAEQRPDKVIPEPGVDVHHRWLAELSRLGYRDPDTLFVIPTAPAGVRVGELDREHAVGQVLTRLGAARSAWNAADIRGEVEQLIARGGMVVDAAVRGELAEDLTARALERCVPLLRRDGLPEHIRALTSQYVLDVECDIAGRLAVRGAEPGHDVEPALLAPAPATGRGLDPGQSAAVAVLAGDRSLVVVEGAAGAGKTTTLAATRELLTGQGHALVVVTPTLKAAKAARVEVGARAGAAAWLAFQHGWRWDGNGTWTRLVPGQLDPVTGRAYEGPDERATLRAGDLLVVDEAGMLDQDNARAVFTIADEHRVRVALGGWRLGPASE
jgi:exodeoxyribonuclease V alpha subunit